ncbi:uncharacterized protein LOC111482146 [Cucurbita maxima]|uniref:Uncharacterized protein LOC111482146 n=1 Tax=Cucurbita maxima TaxID=3661 RepID=A0A6J1J699_CUCMA|nr:uncharacterized protein LOC111482146 [Cucurbita maxima]
MGSAESVQVAEEREEDEEEEEEEEEEEDDDGDDGDDNVEPVRVELENYLVKKVLEQEPEMLPCHALASPLSPQLSSLGTPRLGPAIKVWDPYNVLAPPPQLPPPPMFTRSFSSSSIDDDRVVMEVFLISHGECELNLRSDLVGGRCPEAALTPKGKRQARALAVFLKSQGVRFNAVFSSPLDRARSMAVSVCQEINFTEEQIQTSDALTEMSQGHWERCLRSEIYTPETLSFIDRMQPDFSPPAGESLRQVEFRMVHFLNGTILELPEKLRSDVVSHHPNETLQISHELTNSIHDRDSQSLPSSQWDLPQRQRHGITRKKSGKSRLQTVTTTGEHEADDELSPRDATHQSTLNDLRIRNSSSCTTCIAVFTHSIPIKCLLTGLLECSLVMLHKFCIEDSSVTVLQHSLKSGWQIKTLNDTAHLRLL